MSQLGKVLSKPSGRRLVIPDIHGCFKTLEQLWDKVTPQTEDQVIFLGDYVNKGTSNRKVLDFLMAKSDDFPLYFLRGNHDQKVIDFYDVRDEHMKEELDELNCSDLTELSEQEAKKYREFLESMPYFYISDTYVLVHAGLDFTLTNPFLGKEAMMNIRGFSYDNKKAQNKSIVHGHYPFPLNHIRKEIDNRQKVFPLDNGCVYTDREGHGNLLCLDLDTLELIVQPNIEE